MDVALFDFDGTIADSGPTIMAAASATLTHFGYPVPPPEHLRGFVGPPLLRGITEVLGGPAELAPEFRTHYRATYIEHMTEAVPFPGIPDLLTALAEAWVVDKALARLAAVSVVGTDAVLVCDRHHDVAETPAEVARLLRTHGDDVATAAPHWGHT